ncbi:hypothetical protein [Circovirus-like genome DCCV-9]|uniref:hypothetical protein n=1 Tax=Circovirus-like genome DCCV-9 TaxID=1788449 RepID=UPI0007F9B45A|nr:hypothetical protein [Circovirus-like genome DCCV-9]AMB42979.1 hypothetical protein [Circovirus-like genome DCCV-9]
MMFRILSGLMATADKKRCFSIMSRTATVLSMLIFFVRSIVILFKSPSKEDSSLGTQSGSTLPPLDSLPDAGLILETLARSTEELIAILDQESTCSSITHT